MQKLLIALAIVGLRILATTAQSCKVCQTANSAYCYNQTHFYNCMKNEITGDLDACSTGEVCSNSPAVCVPTADITDTIVDVCGSNGNGNCGSCSGSTTYTCVSSNQFARCVGGVTSSVYDCGANEVCVLSALTDYGTICVPNCTLSFLDLEATCSNDGNVKTTTVAPSTTTGVYTNVCDDAATSTELYFYTMNTADSSCRSYIYCQRSSTSAAFNVALYLSCPTTKPYYDNTQNACVTTKPSGC
ncbi:uncharacterized protein [Drosophila tropicalis]|uniref:uncharacterized protein n=1 Tax=Drosophila tropicalis TaxID=46794 RepID=UPI0035ABB607